MARCAWAGQLGLITRLVKFDHHNMLALVVHGVLVFGAMFLALWITGVRFTQHKLTLLLVGALLLVAATVLRIGFSRTSISRFLSKAGMREEDIPPELLPKRLPIISAELIIFLAVMLGLAALSRLVK